MPVTHKRVLNKASTSNGHSIFQEWHFLKLSGKPKLHFQFTNTCNKYPLKKKSFDQLTVLGIVLPMFILYNALAEIFFTVVEQMLSLSLPLMGNTLIIRITTKNVY